MTTPLLAWVEKATGPMTTVDIETNGGDLVPEQARQFLRDAITPTAILSRADVFDSTSKKFEIPKFSFGSRIMYGGNAAKRDLEGNRVQTASRAKPDTGLVTLSTELFKGEVELSDETFEDNIEGDAFADTLMEQIALAVGRDLEDIAIKSDTADADDTYGLYDGIVWHAKNGGATLTNAAGVTSAKGLFRSMLTALPARYRGLWNDLVFYVSVDAADGWAEEVGERGTTAGDSALTQDTNRGLKPYRGIPVVEVPLLSGTQNAYNYGTVAILCHPKNLKVGFHRRVRVEKFRDPREGNTSFLPTLRYDVKWAQETAVVLAEGVPSFSDEA